MTHKHHLKPRHLGGTDDPSNLLEVTPEEHALIHEARWYAYGHEYDRIAWLALTAQIGKEEALALALKSPERGRKISEATMGKPKPWLVGRKHSEERKRKIGLGNRGKTHRHSEEAKQQMSITRKGRTPWNKGVKYSEEMRKKMSETMKQRWHNGFRGRWAAK